MNEDAITFIRVLVILVSIGLWAFILKGMACEGRSVSFEDYRYGITTGCMVKHKEA